jgi:hypothetical protein
LKQLVRFGTGQHAYNDRFPKIKTVNHVHSMQGL